MNKSLDNPTTQKYTEILMMSRERINTDYGMKRKGGIAELLNCYYMERVKWENALVKFNKSQGGNHG